MVELQIIDIDAVITWVDGKDPDHAAKRAEHMGPGNKGEAYSKSRWVQSNEVINCLKSIGKFAPWIRRIWIVTDNQSPNISSLDKSLQDKIEIVDHKVIFQGHENCLPTFNSVSIEGALHRIPGLAERFIYFNDDFLILDDCGPQDFFPPDGLILRGNFVEDFVKKGLYSQHRLNAAQLAGFQPGKIFRSAHVCHPILKSLLDDFYASNPGLLEQNIRFRFRDKSQFLVSTLVEHLAIVKGIATLHAGDDCHLIAAGNCPSGDVKAARKQMAKLLAPGIKLGCINNYKDLMAADPKLLAKLDRRLGPRRSKHRVKAAATFWFRLNRLLRSSARRLLWWRK